MATLDQRLRTLEARARAPTETSDLPSGVRREIDAAIIAIANGEQIDGFAQEVIEMVLHVRASF